MIETVAALGVIACAGGAVYAGLTYGVRYIDHELRSETRVVRLDQPIIAPPHPSGIQLKSGES